MDLKGKKGFVVNTLTTANQRASSKGSAHSSSTGLSNFVQKLVGQQQKGQTPHGENNLNLSSILKVNNLTGNDQENNLIGQRSSSIAANNTTFLSKQQNKHPSTQRDPSSSSAGVVSDPKVII